jgi:putative transcriptional regulator
MILNTMNLTGQFLIAMPAMQDPYFSKTVIFICTHNEDGAMGLVLNRPLDITLDHVLEQIKLSSQSHQINDAQIYNGGPVQTERGFVLHSTEIEYNATHPINKAVSLTTSKDILEEVAQNKVPSKMLVALGYAGWTAGQLEDEMLDNAWLTFSINQEDTLHQLIFELPFEKKFEAAMALAGVNYATLSEVAGHA